MSVNRDAGGSPLVAWGDESGSAASTDPGVYLMSAVITEVDRAHELRNAIRPMLLPSRRKVHWRGDSRAQHDRVIELMTGLPIEALVVVRIGPDTDRDERQRRKCLEHFLPELSERGCDHLILESRGRADDRRDRNMLDALRAQRRISGFRLEHVAGPADPVLWLADAVCGAVVASRTGEPHWLAAIEDQVTVHHVDE